MKKILTLSLMLLMIAGFSVCQAAITVDRMTAGGVYIGQNLTEVVAMYGNPVTKKSERFSAPFPHTEYTYKYGQYGTTFDIVADGKTEEASTVLHIRVSGNNGIATKDGIKVGMSASEVTRILGKPDYKNGNLLSYNELRKSSYAPPKFLEIKINNGVVTSYYIGTEM